MFESLRGLIIGILCYYSINNEVYFFYNFRPNSSLQSTCTGKEHKIMDRPFKPKYGTVSQVLLQLVVALVCPQHDIWETSADIPHWWCISRQLWVVPNWLCREKNLLQPQRKTTKIYHLGSEPHQYGISTLFCSLISHGNQQWCHEMSATF